MPATSTSSLHPQHPSHADFLDIRSLPGRFFVFEGIDGSGKSTQCQTLAHTLRQAGHSVIETREPTNGPWGQQLRTLAQQGTRLAPTEELQLFLRDRKAHIQDLILPHLRQGSIVLQDRYFPSSMAYQGSQGIPPQTILSAHLGWTPLPHAFFFLRLAPEIALQRISERRQIPDAFETFDGLQRCDAIFSTLSLPHWHTLDASLPTHTLQQELLHIVQPLLPAR
jgi:dTMP kinase